MDPPGNETPPFYRTKKPTSVPFNLVVANSVINTVNPDQFNNLHFYFRQFFIHSNMLKFYKHLVDTYTPFLTHNQRVGLLNIIVNVSKEFAINNNEEANVNYDCDVILSQFINVLNTNIQGFFNDIFHAIPINGSIYWYDTVNALNNVLFYAGRANENSVLPVPAVGPVVPQVWPNVPPLLPLYSLNVYGNVFGPNACMALRLIAGALGMMLDILVNNNMTKIGIENFNNNNNTVPHYRVMSEIVGGLITNGNRYFDNTGVLKTVIANGVAAAVDEVSESIPPDKYDFFATYPNTYKHLLDPLIEYALMTRYEFQFLNPNTYLTTVGAGSCPEYTIYGLNYSFNQIYRFLDEIFGTILPPTPYPHLLNYNNYSDFKNWLLTTDDENLFSSEYEDKVIEQFKNIAETIDVMTETPILQYAENKV
jgi:hypothetical protein